MINRRQNTILLVDSNKKEAKVLFDKLNSVGFSVLLADSEELALKLVQISNPDLVLIDILMESKQSGNILTTIKSKMQVNTPLIIISSDIDVNSKVYSFLMGANDYIVKPFRFPEVLARINTQLRLLNMQKELEEKNRELIEKNALLEQMAITDGLTELYNKTYMLKRITDEISHCARYNEYISFIMIDIDFFKQINDVYGHIVGDLILKGVSKKISSSIREVDIAARYGGEEFLIVCPNTNLTGAKILAERIRDTIQSVPFKVNCVDISVTISVGIRSIIPNSDMSRHNEIDKIISDADIALYKAKATGRNKVEVYENMYGLVDTIDKQLQN